MIELLYLIMVKFNMIYKGDEEKTTEKISGSLQPFIHLLHLKIEQIMVKIMCHHLLLKWFVYQLWLSSYQTLMVKPFSPILRHLQCSHIGFFYRQ